VYVRYLRVTGAVIGVHFVNYQASVNTDITPGATETVVTPADFFDVDGVASGYVNAKMEAVDQQRATIATQSFVADVTGKLASSEGLLLIELIAFAVISLVDIGFSVSRRKLPRNRFVTGILFAAAAATTVLALVIGAAMARVALFEATAWLPALFLATAGAFFLGYISPGRLTRTATEEADDKVIDLVAAGAVARATGEQQRRTTGGSVPHSSGDFSHASGDFSHASGEFSSHDSGQFSSTQQQSGEFSITPQDSGAQDPVAD
jgi:hypothetical protein